MLTFDQVCDLLPIILQSHQDLFRKALENERGANLTEPCNGVASDQATTITLLANRGFNNVFSLIVSKLNEISNDFDVYQLDELTISMNSNSEHKGKPPEHFIGVINTIIQKLIEPLHLKNEELKRDSNKSIDDSLWDSAVNETSDSITTQNIQLFHQIIQSNKQSNEQEIPKIRGLKYRKVYGGPHRLDSKLMSIRYNRV